MRVRTLLVALTATSLGAADAAAQDSTNACTVELRGADFVGLSADLARTLDLLGPGSANSTFLRRISDRTRVNVCPAPASLQQLTRSVALPRPPGRGLDVLPVDGRVGYNSAYPRDWNDGTFRGGGGLSLGVAPGLEFRWDFVEAAIVPWMVLEENASYARHLDTIPGLSPFAHRWHGGFIDLPQRFGTESVARLSAGQSYVRVHGRGFRAGLSTENLSWGPARRNPLLLSGTAAGFPHVFVETARPHDVGFADAEFQLLWGRLSESGYFDFDPDNDHRALTGAMLVLRPRGLDGLYLGAGYLHSQPWGPGTPFSDVLWGGYTGIGRDSLGLPRSLRLLGLSMRWTAAPGGFEVYGEWARQDTFSQWWRMLNETDAPQAYTLGVQRVVRRGDNAVRLSAEISHLSDALPHASVGRGIHTYYVSPHVPQGHTHQGQLLGAPIGPASESQFIGADVFWRYGRSSISVERARYDDDAYYAAWAQIHGPHGHDTEISMRLGHAFAGRQYSVEAELGYSFRYSRSFLGLFFSNFVDYPYREDHNVGLRVVGRWMPDVPALVW